MACGAPSLLVISRLDLIRHTTTEGDEQAVQIGRVRLRQGLQVRGRPYALSATCHQAGADAADAVGTAAVGTAAVGTRIRF